MTDINEKRVLVVEAVEDDAFLRKALHEKLTQEGFQLLEASDGEEGLALALQNHPDLILLDILLPHMDGLTMLKKLREDAWGKTARVIILTNVGDTSKIAEALGHNVFEYYVKSDTPIENLVESVKKKLLG